MRKQLQRETRAWLELTELATSAPRVAAGRLQRASAMSAAAAWIEWSAWAMEKMFAWQLVALRAWSEAAAGTQPTMASAMHILAPVSSRVRRNMRHVRR